MPPIALRACWCSPSLSEGFGLPVLEAMARGTPVVCSNAGALPEVADDAALLHDPLDASALARMMRMMWSIDPVNADYAQRGKERARLNSPGRRPPGRRGRCT